MYSILSNIACFAGGVILGSCFKGLTVLADKTFNETEDITIHEQEETACD